MVSFLAYREHALRSTMHVNMWLPWLCATWILIVLLLVAQKASDSRYSMQVYRDLAAEDGIPLDSAPHGVRDFSLTALPGGYRRLLHRPRDLNWRLLRYSDPDAPLAHSTLDRLSGAPPPSVQPISPGGHLNISLLSHALLSMWARYVR